MNYRNRRLLDLAHRVDECQHCGKYTPGCEPAHANWQEYGKGGALKAHDFYHAALCHECHAALDQGNTMDKAEKKDMWLRAHLKTIALYWKNEWVRVA